MSSAIAILRIVYVVLIVAAGALPAHAMGGGPPAWTMTLNYCRQTVANKGVTE
jgi:hypothetical protein